MNSVSRSGDGRSDHNGGAMKTIRAVTFVRLSQAVLRQAAIIPDRDGERHARGAAQRLAVSCAAGRRGDGCHRRHGRAEAMCEPPSARRETPVASDVVDSWYLRMAKRPTGGRTVLAMIAPRFRPRQRRAGARRGSGAPREEFAHVGTFYSSPSPKGILLYQSTS